jgi:phage-related protein (TIGR01555 family)
MASAVPYLDTLVNFLSSIGVPGRDKATGSVWTFTPMQKGQIDNAYRSDWMARKLIDIPAKDATRQWRSWHTELADIEKLEREEKRLDIPGKLRKALIMSRLYGGSVLILGVERGKMSEELDLDKIRKGDLKFVHACSRYAVGQGPWITDAMSPYYGMPEYFTRTQINSPTSVSRTNGTNTISGQEFQIHPSRVVMLRGMNLPDQESSGEWWGDSVLQSVNDAITNAATVSQAGATLVNETKIDVIKIPQLSMHMTNQDYKNRLSERFSYANTAKSVINTLLIDKEEEWQRIEAQLGGLPDVLKLYLLIACGAADVPATRFLGQSPQGLNSTGESDIRNYYDRIHSEQETDLTPAIQPLDEVLIRSALGSRDPSIYYEWNKLWQMDDLQHADIAVRKAQVFQIDVSMGLMDPEALRIGRQNQLVEDGIYPGLELALEKIDMLDLDSMKTPEEQDLDKMLEPDGSAPGSAQPSDQETAQDFTPPTGSGADTLGPSAGIVGKERMPTTSLSKTGDALKDAFNPDLHPHQPQGQETGGEFAPKGTGTTGKRVDAGLNLKQVSTRAWNGEPATVQRPMARGDTGNLGESIALAYLQQIEGHVDAVIHGLGHKEKATDILAGRYLIEVKAGLASNQRSSMSWANKEGEPGEAEKQWRKTASREEIADLGKRRQADRMERKNKRIKELSKELGVKLQPKTLTMIIHPDTRTADIHLFDGYHTAIGWKSPQTPKAYIGTFHYGKPSEK